MSVLSGKLKCQTCHQSQHQNHDKRPLVVKLKLDLSIKTGRGNGEDTSKRKFLPGISCSLFKNDACSILTEKKMRKERERARKRERRERGGRKSQRERAKERVKRERERKSHLVVGELLAGHREKGREGGLEKERERKRRGTERQGYGLGWNERQNTQNERDKREREEGIEDASEARERNHKGKTVT